MPAAAGNPAARIACARRAATASGTSWGPHSSGEREPAQQNEPEERGAASVTEYVPELRHVERLAGVQMVAQPVELLNGRQPLRDPHEPVGEPAVLQPTRRSHQLL